MMFKKLSLVTVLLLIFANAFGQVNSCDEERLKAFNPITGTVPLSFGQMPSTDLECDRANCLNSLTKGDIFTPDQAAKYFEELSAKTNCQFSLADLEPAQIPNVWSSQIGKEIKSDDGKLAIKSMDEVDFVSKAWSKSGSYRVTVNKRNHFGTSVQYSLFLNKSIHNYLLRKNLLVKLGYDIPPMKYLKRVVLNFESKEQKKEFIEKLEISTTGSYDRWITGQTQKSVVLQDLIATEDQEFKINFAKGYISPERFEGKRVYKSLLIPFALTNVHESINMFSWTAGRIVSENVKLEYPNAGEYRITRDDAVWMIRRLMQLTSDDWWEIVDKTYIPSSVKLLLFEKLKSRRNHLGTLFGVDNVNLPVNSFISNSDDLVEGRLTKEFYAGYARRFKISDPTSPLSYSEMMAFLKSKALSTGIDLAVNSFNSASFTGTDISKKINEFNEKTLAEAMAENLTTDATVRTPVKAFAFPTIKGNLILNRDIVAGSYLGTDNTIQLVDTVGASVSAGVFGGVTGVYSETGKIVTTAAGVVRQQVPVDINARANVYYNRTYSHVRPIDSVQKAIKYPFKNMFVPYLKRHYGHLIDSLMNAEYQNLTPGQQIDTNRFLVKNLKQSLDSISFSYDSVEDKFKSDELSKLIQETLTYLENTKEDFINEVSDGPLTQSFISKFIGFAQQAGDLYSFEKDCFKKTISSVCGLEESGTVNAFISEIFSNANKLSTLVESHSLKLNGKEEEADIKNVLDLFDQNLAIGESIIVTDSVGGNLGVGAGLSLYSVAKLNVDLSAKKYVTARLHFLRKSETEIHVYRDLGNVNSLEASLGVQAYVPVLKLTVKGSKGNAKTNFYKINIGEEEDSFYKTKNINQASNLRALRSVLMTGSTSRLKSIKKPVVIKHKFKESNNKLGLFVWRWNKLKQSDRVTVILPSGDSKQLYRRVLGKTKGRDYENYFNDLVSFFTSKILKTNFSASSFSAGNPGFTYMGQARNRVISLEGYMANNKVDKPFIKLSHIVNGWKIGKEKILEEMKLLKDKYHFSFFDSQAFSQTKEIFLYNINLNFFIYDTGLKNMLSLSDDEISDIWKKFQTRDNVRFSGDDELKHSGITRFFNLKKRYLKQVAKNHLDRSSKLLMKMTAVVDDKLSIAGISRIYGGAQNFMALARVDGFRVGDENGDQGIISNTFGRIGKYRTLGPLGQMRKFLGATTGEFTLSWLLGRVI